MVSSASTSEPFNGVPTGPIDAYVLFEALTGRKLDRTSFPVRPAAPEDYDDLSDIDHGHQMLGDEPSPDDRPNHVQVGVINPYALVENMIGHKIDRNSRAAIRILSDTLQTDYEELFDMKHNSVLHAGLKLNEKDREAEELSEKEMRILDERDLVTPDLSRVLKVGDLEKIGLKDLGNTRIKRACLENGKLHLVLNAHTLGKTVCNREVTMTMNELCLPFRRDDNKKDNFRPPNSSWRDVREALLQNRHNSMSRHPINAMNSFHDFGWEAQGRHHHMRMFDDPVQGAAANSWFIAALFSVFWADPTVINRSAAGLHEQMRRGNDEQQQLHIKFHDKGGRNNAKTSVVRVDYEVPVNNSSSDPVYCRSSDGFAVWPSLYEKAFAKWITNNSNNSDSEHHSEHIDITQTHHGDPVKAMAQLNGRSPHYYFTHKHSGPELVGLVRANSVNHRTITPMVAWTHATGRDFTYRGANMVANHAYSVLGWSSTGQGEKQYIIIRNPWGVTEPHGVTSYPGLLDRVEPEYWRPAACVDRDGLYALEVTAFKEYFACIGVAK
ncbi:Uu.00g099310.m01.CDS01 [Anthostomella pinea]|uniref:Uu.00g099310.m01.CDS01 n=1 Tax=Anthostomella pinea TaxID=933095 RepID=A0AAI8VDB4_9PEZI|nr:Uu.00g099310.m01.CDS01 [Anthostomella pinea]